MIVHLYEEYGHDCVKKFPDVCIRYLGFKGSIFVLGARQGWDQAPLLLSG